MAKGDIKEDLANSLKKAVKDRLEPPKKAPLGPLAHRRAGLMLRMFEKFDREQEVGSYRLVVLKGPGGVRNAEGEVVGFRVRVRLFLEGKEVPIDPDRVFINPPLKVVVDGVRIGDPRAAFWAILWESVLSAPGEPEVGRR